MLRGEYVLRNIIGVPPAPPPPEVEADLDSVAAEQSLTVRERLAIHRENPSCNGCHGIIDPLGFALENFDADGTWRDVDRESGRAIDASGLLPDGSEIDGPDALRAALLERPEQFVQTFVEKLLAYALGRSTDWYDMPAVRRSGSRKRRPGLSVFRAGHGDSAKCAVRHARRWRGRDIRAFRPFADGPGGRAWLVERRRLIR